MTASQTILFGENMSGALHAMMSRFGRNLIFEKLMEWNVLVKVHQLQVGLHLALLLILLSRQGG